MSEIVVVSITSTSQGLIVSWLVHQCCPHYVRKYNALVYKMKTWLLTLWCSDFSCSPSQTLISVANLNLTVVLRALWSLFSCSLNEIAKEHNCVVCRSCSSTISPTVITGCLRTNHIRPSIWNCHTVFSVLDLDMITCLLIPSWLPIDCYIVHLSN